MSLIGLQTYLAFKIKFLLPNKNFFFISFLLGLMIPEIDIVIISIYNLLLDIKNINPMFEKNFTHSIITLSIIYLIFLIIYEIKKDEIIINIGKGIIGGMSINIILDIIFRLNNLDVFWPLPIGKIKSWNYSEISLKILMGLEFLFFRLIASKIIKISLDNPLKCNGKNIKYLSYLMKLESIFILIFILITTIIPSFINSIFIILYIISYIATLLLIYQSKDTIEYYSIK